MKILILSLVCLSSLYGQAVTAGKLAVAGSARMSASQSLPFNTLTLSTQNSLAPSASLLTGFPTISGNPAEGYQGGNYINGMALFTPWQYRSATPHGTLLAYTGGPSGAFHCTSPAQCAANYDWFDMTTLPMSCPSGYTCPSQDAATGYTCGSVVDNNNIVYYIPGADNQNPVMMSFNPFGTAGTRGTAVSNAANYAHFSAPAANSGSPLGKTYGWCTGVFDGRYVYYAPTAAGTFLSNTNFLRYDTQAASWPSAFTIANFSSYDLSTGPGGAKSCCYLSSAYDGAQNIYLLPLNGAYLTVYNKLASGGFKAAASYKVLNMANLGTAGYPQVTGNGNLKAVQTASGYVGGQMVWNVSGTTEYLYMAPFAILTGNSQANQVLQSTVIRVPVATCSPGVANSQTCTGTFTPLDITASTSTWEIFDLANLAANQAWPAAGYASPAIYGTASSYGNTTLANQLVLGGFQLTWLNVKNAADPVVGFIADFGMFYARHHVSHSLSDPSGWDLAERPATQTNGCMGGGYDPANQLLYVSCPGTTPIPSAWQIGPL